ncbi:DUF4179 domain-containing protein [Brevibacillus sp. HB2.2]|uniref:DUF4179 domain-containing protein n=1 Tax=Brevibacillus sp. HB2.2 TaxID=2738846 RepID=UPI00156B5E8B|nr:DUF4179 domain-containing protein [Brevibacillus sp. HB2.2]NRS50357.1 DUF4179 domain-containing protein [Brevibacillus sp. HB2.2]
MREKIHAYKEQVDHIPVPTEKLDAIIAQTVQQAVPKRKRLNKRKLVYSTGAAVVALGVLFSSAAVSPVMANLVSKVPLIGSIFSAYGDNGLKLASEKGLTTVIGESQDVDGHAITVNEVYYDGTRFTIGYTLETKQAVGEHYLGSSPDLTVNGKAFGYAGSSKHTQITPTLATGIVDIDAINGLPEEFKLGLSFHGEDGKQWNFSLPIISRTDTKRIAINHQQKAGGIDLTVPDITMGPAGLVVSFQAVTEEIGYLSSYLEFKVVDDKGNELGAYSGGSQGKKSDGKEYLAGTRRFDPVTADVKELRITPYLSLPSQGGGVGVDKNGKETIIQSTIEMIKKQGKDIEFKTFTVTLKK